mgnify:CR=1 FL=1
MHIVQDDSKLCRLSLQMTKRVGMSLMFFLASLSIYGQYKVERLILSGRVALHYEDYVLSIQYFNQALTQKPFLWEPWQLRAIAKFYLDDWSGAEADASRAIELNPYITELYDLRGISRIRMEQYADAIDDYSKAISLEPGNRNYWYNRAACYMEQKDYDNALLQLDTIIGKWKDYAPTYLLKAEVYLNRKDTLTAEDWVKKSLEVDSFNANAWRFRANLALQNEHWKDADVFFSKSLHLKPKDSGSLINRALARLRLNNLRGAMSDYDDALEYDPNSFLAHYNRGLLRQQVGDDNRAIEDFDYVLTFEPDNVMALLNRATLLDKTGNLRGAIRDYSKVIEKFPNFWTGLHYRAECYRRLGMRAKAEQDEFRILKAQMDKHLGKQTRWSSKKVAAVRKMSDIDPEKYNQVVVEDNPETVQEYKSEYRGKVQNRQVTEQYQPYIALTYAERKGEMGNRALYDDATETVRMKMSEAFGSYGISIPQLGCVGEGSGVQTASEVDTLSAVIRKTKETKTAELLLLARAVAYSSEQNYQEALKDINDYLQINPSSFIALWQRAVCSAMIVEYEKGLTPKDAALRKAGVQSDFDKLIELAPHDANVLYSYGTFCARIQEYDKAIDLLTKAIEQDVQLSYAYYNRGLAYLASGKAQQAKADFSKAGELGLYNAYSLMKKKGNKN